MSAERSGNGFKLNGTKGMVLDGHVADQLIVAARTSGEAGDDDGLTLFLVDPKSKGISQEKISLCRQSRCVPRLNLRMWKSTQMR